mgnify:CR=1 FL=1
MIAAARLLYFYLGFRDRMLKKEARRVKEYAAKHRGRILRSLKGEGIKKTDKARLFLFVWAPGIYYRFVLWHARSTLLIIRFLLFAIKRFCTYCKKII